MLRVNTGKEYFWGTWRDRQTVGQTEVHIQTDRQEFRISCTEIVNGLDLASRPSHHMSPALTNIAQQHWQKHQPMQGPPQQHAHVHSEVVDLKKLRFGKEEDKYSKKLSHSDSTDHLWKGGREGGREGKR